MRETVDRAPAKIGRDHEIEGSTPSLFLFSFFLIGESQMENVYKEVYFNKYCPICEYYKKAETDDPCDECLSEPVNE